jgi:tryptophanyl-tRNA synthetase
MPYQPDKLRTNTWELIFNLMAVGVKPEYLFIQSLVPEHTELCWIFNCFCSYGQLTRMTQFKDKSQQSGSSDDGFISAGLLDYPVLQAADILIYRADFVPVGKEYFVLPEPLFTETPKIRSTADPTRKMSKSAGEKHYINVFAEENRIRKQIRSAVTDTGDTPEGEMSPGVDNLFTLLRAAGRQEAHESLMQDYRAGNLKYVDLKDAVADGLVELSERFRERKAELKADKKNVKSQIKASSDAIRKKAQETVKEVKELAGLMNVRF